MKSAISTSAHTSRNLTYRKVLKQQRKNIEIKANTTTFGNTTYNKKYHLQSEVTYKHLKIKIESYKLREMGCISLLQPVTMLKARIVNLYKPGPWTVIYELMLPKQQLISEKELPFLIFNYL